ncbi:MAG: AAA family ATPase [Phycisphaeraceae bacterium]|nr:AAA family ATPase [Phycisphaeraceae bacterium]
MLNVLSDQLGVTVESLQALGVSRNGSGWRIPERNGQGEIIGHSIRRDDGSKTFEPGGHRGLTLAWPLHDYAGSSDADPVIIVEGASDAAAGMDLDFVTIGRPSCTGGLDFLRELLADRHVLIIGENDTKPDADPDTRPGKVGAEKIASGLLGIAASVRVIFPPEGVKDLRAWTIAGATRLDVMDAAERAVPLEAPPPAPTAGPILLNLADIEAQPVRWLWPGRIALGKVTIFAGDPGLGKSFVTLDIASRVTTGAGWPDAPGQRFDAGGVVLLNAEDDAADTIKPRLTAAGANVRRINVLQAVRRVDDKTGATLNVPFHLADIKTLEDAIARTPDCRLVIVDPITAYLGDTDSHVNAEVRALLAPLAALASRRQVAVVCVSHLNKATGTSAVYRIMGSLAFAAAARAVWAISKDRDNAARRLMTPVKNNIALDQTGLAFTLAPSGDQAVVAWEDGPISATADDALGDGSQNGGDDALADACRWLREFLLDGPKPAKDIKAAALADSITSRTLDRAKSELGVLASRMGFGEGSRWVWGMPS